MSYIAAGGTCVACPSFIGNTAGAAAGAAFKTYWSQNFYAGQYWNSNFWNGHQALVPPGTGKFFDQNSFKGEFWRSLFYRA